MHKHLKWEQHEYRRWRDKAHYALIRTKDQLKAVDAFVTQKETELRLKPLLAAGVDPLSKDDLLQCSYSLIRRLQGRGAKLAKEDVALLDAMRHHLGRTT